MERHKQTLPMVHTHTSYIKIFALFLGLAVSSLGHAKSTTDFSSFFHKNIQLLKTNLLETQSFEMPEICDNGIDDDGDGLIDCFDPDCSNSCITGNLSRSFTSSSTNYGFFSYDPDPNCASTDWGDDWTKFQSPEWFYMDEYDDGSFIMRGRIVNLTDVNDSWEIWIRLHNKRSWAEWSALGRMFYEPSTGGNCSANHTTWDFYETDETASRWYGTPGSANEGKVVTINHSPADYSKGVQVGFGANNCETCSCSSFNVRGWYKMNGDLELPCGDYGSVMSGFETMNECNVYNGDFEDGLNYWDARDGVSVTNDAASGNSAGVINRDNGTLSQILLPATPDYSYVASIQSKIANAPSDAILLMEFYDAFLNPLERYATEVTNTSYQEYTFGGVAPQNSAYVSVWGWKGNGGSFYLDEFCLEIDKSYSESNCQDIQNGGFEDGSVTDWNSWGTVTATSSAYAGNYAALISGGDGGLDQTFNVTAGETYNFETYIKETNIDGNTSYGISWLDASGTNIYSLWQAYFTADYEKYQLLSRAPANAVQARIWVIKNGNGELYVDDNCFKVFERKPPTEDCTNGVDDDGDGVIDNYDEDCCPNLSSIPQSNYSLHFVDSEQVGFGEATNAFDGNTETYWHTNFDNTTYPLPHEIQIDLGSNYKIGGFRYLPVLIAADGRIKDFEVYVSDNPNSWGSTVATGTFTYNDLGDKEVSFPLTEGRYFRLVALSEINNNEWTTAAEINILECKGREICDNGIDDDGDGLVDCEDCEDCYSSSNCPDYDSDGIGDFCDMDDDNDGILDTIECPIANIPTTGGFLTNSNINFNITTNTFPGDEDGQHTLNSITISGQSYPYSDFITPDFFTTSLPVPSYSETVHNQFGSTTSYLGRDYNLNPSTFETDIVPVFQDRNLNSFMEVDGGAAGNNYVLSYSNPIEVTQGLYVVVIERGGNNDQSIIARDVNGDLGTVFISSGTYIDLGFKAGGNDYQNLRTSIFSLTDLAPVGSLLTELQINFETTESDGPDGKVFIFGEENYTTCVDTDGDGIPDYQDLDSDGDGCPDAVEGDASFENADLVASNMLGGNNGSNYTGTWTQPVVANLGNMVDTDGVPDLNGAPQGIGDSQNGAIQPADCLGSEICDNGIDDDGDGFIDGGDTDCSSDCNESLLFVARANAQILQVNLNTGATSIAGTSPYTNENLNAMAANPDAGIVYYGHHKTVYYWNPSTGNHGVLVDLTNQVGINETLTSGGGAYFNNQLYLGFEDDVYLDQPSIYRLPLAVDGLSTTGVATNLNVPIPTNTSWGDMIVSAENGNTVIYAGLSYNTLDGNSLYFKYAIERSTFTTIRTDMPSALQIGVDVDGNLWAGGLEDGTIQQMDKATGNFFGTPIYIGGDMWDLTGPINCPQQVEICDNGKDDDGDGRIDSDDDDCNCPTIATTDNRNVTVCSNTDVTFTVVTDASNLPFTEIEFYSFTAAQSNPYSAMGDNKKLIGKFDNNTGMGSIVSNDFATNNGLSSSYYVYAVLSPAPSDLTDCLPFLEYIITAESCQEICGNGIDDDGDELIDCQDPDCDNPNDGGWINGNESNCGLYTPTLITEQTAPSGLGANIPEYQWEQSFNNTNWTDIQGATQSTYVPSLISQTTYYRRELRRNTCNPWITSNTVTKTVTPSTFDAEIINIPSGVNGYLCNSEGYVFQAAAVDEVIYTWEFGAYANPSTATGIGPHTVYFNTPSDNLPISSEVILRVIGTAGALCIDIDTLPINLRPLSNVVTVNHEDPSVCGASDGWITLTTSGEIGGCIEVSLDGGISYEPEGQVSFTNLPSGSYEIVTRYCDNGCPNIAQIVNLSDPATINLVNDDFDNVCPGFNYSSNVFINDDIKGDIVLSLASNGNYGTVVLEDNGGFVYTPHAPTCDMDQFSYTVCDPGMNCCVTAVVTIDFNDEEAPVLINVPDDLTINCDEEIPLPPLVTASDNCPAISIDKNEVSTQGEEGCSLYDYSVTYTWIAQDFCGNEAIDSQQVFIKDQTAPDIYRIYTLPNGKKLVAGVMENVTHRWKVVQLPIEFNTRPLVFSQLITADEASPAIVRLRNISANQFEVKLQEEAANDNQRTGESVAWFAIEAGTQLSDYQLDAGLFSVGNAVRNITFQNGFSQTPAFFTSMQSIVDADPAYPRSENLSNNGVSVNIQEEASVDSDISHTQEKLAYLAIDTSILHNREGDVLGETGRLKVDDTWQTIELSNTYTNPVVIANILSLNEADPAIVQVDNVTPESFDIRIKEWDYLDGNHALEDINFIVIEGSVPLSSEKFCDFGTDSLVLGVDIVAVDNCDQNVTISYQEVESFSGPRQLYTRIWSAVDECGNETLYAKDVICEGVYVRIKAMLQGATIYNDDGLMRDDLRKKGLIPLEEPYTANPNFKHIGEGGNETLEESMITITGPDACVDWVFVELCDGNDLSNVVATQSAIIQRDGDVMTVKGDTLIRFENVPPGDYFVALSHRNHLKTVSLYPYTFTPNTVPTVNFMDDFTPVIGIEPNIDLGQGTRALWSGDLNGDERVIYQGPQNDVFDMFLHVILDSINGQFLTNFISSGYTNNDFNMDGTVIFQGPNNDKSTMLFNTILKHPNNPANFSNFVIATHAQAQIIAGNNPDGTIAAFDFDMDGIQDGVDPDDDNDGVADGNDVDPKNKNSDSDGDGVADDVETGKDGHYDYLVDSDPLNPCSPTISSLCSGIDADNDGFFRNYPTNHPKYDVYDENACLPDFNNSNCSCSENIIDNGNEVLVKICSKQENGNFETLQIPLSALPAYLELGDICGPCNE